MRKTQHEMHHVFWHVHLYGPQCSPGNARCPRDKAIVASHCVPCFAKGRTVAAIGWPHFVRWFPTGFHPLLHQHWQRSWPLTFSSCSWGTLDEPYRDILDFDLEIFLPTTSWTCCWSSCHQQGHHQGDHTQALEEHPPSLQLHGEPAGQDHGKHHRSSWKRHPSDVGGLLRKCPAGMYLQEAWLEGDDLRQKFLELLGKVCPEFICRARSGRAFRTSTSTPLHIEALEAERDYQLAMWKKA